MIYLSSFTLPSRIKEDGYILSYPKELEMLCYSANNAYPFKVFPEKQLSRLDFSPITIFYGTNGSGKSTLLNIIAEKLGVLRTAPFNDSACMKPYLELCEAETVGNIPRGSRIITSDEVFDFLIGVREVNSDIDRKRSELFAEWDKAREEYYKPLTSLDELEEFRRRNEARLKTKSQFTARRVPKELTGKSNGESAYLYFTERITENAIYLLDEPENSLSARLQVELARFISDSARFYRCQFIISTHSPFLLSLTGATVYDLDSRPAAVRPWHELDAVRVYYDFFKEHSSCFEK